MARPGSVAGSIAINSLLAIYPEVVRGTAALPGYCYVKCNAGIALQITGMQYVITAAGSLGFQVTAVGEGANGLIADFASRAEAEAFVASMRRLDAGCTHSIDDPEEPR